MATKESEVTAVARVFDGVTPEQLQQAVQAAGYGAVVEESDGVPTCVRSAVVGAKFRVYLFTGPEDDTAKSVQFRAGWTIDDAPANVLELVNQYNFDKRFGKVTWEAASNALAIEFDAFTCRGVTAGYLDELIQCWAWLMDDFLQFMRPKLFGAE